MERSTGRRILEVTAIDTEARTVTLLDLDAAAEAAAHHNPAPSPVVVGLPDLDAAFRRDRSLNEPLDHDPLLPPALVATGEVL